MRLLHFAAHTLKPTNAEREMFRLLGKWVSLYILQIKITDNRLGYVRFDNSSLTHVRIRTMTKTAVSKSEHDDASLPQPV